MWVCFVQATSRAGQGRAGQGRHASEMPRGTQLQNQIESNRRGIGVCGSSYVRDGGARNQCEGFPKTELLAHS